MSNLRPDEAFVPVEVVDPPGNPQLYKNSPLRHDTNVQSMTDGLRGVPPPTFAIVREKPEHRILLLLKLKGLSNREIAEQTGYSEPWVSQVTRQPWFQDMLVEKLAQAGDKLVDDLIALEAKNSVFTLIQLRDDPNQLGSTRAACAKDLLDRYLGKPVQRTENLNINANVKGTITRIDTIDAELAKLEERVQELDGTPKAS